MADFLTGIEEFVDEEEPPETIFTSPARDANEGERSEKRERDLHGNMVRP